MKRGLDEAAPAPGLSAVFRPGLAVALGDPSGGLPRACSCFSRYSIGVIPLISVGGLVDCEQPAVASRRRAEPEANAMLRRYDTSMGLLAWWAGSRRLDDGTDPRPACRGRAGLIAGREGAGSVVRRPTVIGAGSRVGPRRRRRPPGNACHRSKSRRPGQDKR